MSAVSRNETSREQIPRRLKFITPKHSLSLALWVECYACAAHRVKPERERKSTPRACLGKHLHFSIPALSRASTLINTYLHEIVITEPEKCAPLLFGLCDFFPWRGAEVKSDYGPRPAENLWAIAKKKLVRQLQNARRAPLNNMNFPRRFLFLLFTQTWETAATTISAGAQVIIFIFAWKGWVFVLEQQETSREVSRRRSAYGTISI